MHLRPYQDKAVVDTLKAWESWDRVLGAAATGAGKTVIASHILKRRASLGASLFIAHRKELLSQAIDKIDKVNGERWDFKIGLEQASTRGNVDDDVVVASIQSLHKARLERWDPQHFKTIIIDECHRSTAKGYQTVLNYFSSAKTLGITATPDRADQRSLAEVFEHIAFEIPLIELIEKEFLVRIRVEQIPLKIDLSGIKLDSQGDLDVTEVAHVLQPYLGALAAEMAAHAERKILVFLPLVALSKEFAGICRELGIAAEHIDGESIDRKEILERFHDGVTRVVSCAMLLSEGYDEPSIDCICVFRPTQSRTLYCQCLGRGFRISPGKEDLLVLDPLWLSEEHSLVKPANLIAVNAEEADQITELLGSEPDLLGAQQQAREINLQLMQERARRMAERLDATSKRERTMFDPLEVASVLRDRDIADFEPVVAWHTEKVSTKQAEVLASLGINPQAVANKGQASVIITRLFKRRDQKLATFRQLRQLIRFGYRDPQHATFKEANAFLDGVFGSRRKGGTQMTLV
jgi:superfamily II DNA or RNA helicase